MNTLVKSTFACIASFGIAVSAQAQSYDYLLLATSWQPGFCANHTTKPECQSLRGTYAANNIALHGFWPQNYDGTYPSYCNVPQKDISLDQSSQWCSMDAYGISSNTLSTLQKYQPGAGATRSCLDDHEWYKHGSCSGLDPNTYWNEVSGIMGRLGQTSFGLFLHNSAGRYITRTQLVNAFDAALGSGAHAAAGFKCTKIGTKSYLTEIWINLNKTTASSFPNPASLVLDGAVSSSCPTSNIYVALAP